MHHARWCPCRDSFVSPDGDGDGPLLAEHGITFLEHRRLICLARLRRRRKGPSRSATDPPRPSLVSQIIIGTCDRAVIALRWLALARASAGASAARRAFLAALALPRASPASHPKCPRPSAPRCSYALLHLRFRFGARPSLGIARRRRLRTCRSNRLVHTFHGLDHLQPRIERQLLPLTSVLLAPLSTASRAYAAL